MITFFIFLTGPIMQFNVFPTLKSTLYSWKLLLSKDFGLWEPEQKMSKRRVSK